MARSSNNSKNLFPNCSIAIQATLASVVKRNCQLKAQVVVEDERETTGRRALLNYGHTIGHAVESLSGYGTYLHGEAVSIGMVAASRLAEQLGRIDAQVTQRQIDLLEKLGLPIGLPNLDPSAIIESMQHDKKGRSEPNPFCPTKQNWPCRTGRLGRSRRTFNLVGKMNGSQICRLLGINVLLIGAAMSISLPWAFPIFQQVENDRLPESFRPCRGDDSLRNYRRYFDPVRPGGQR